jgi:ketol-acid reductoisomerase
MTDLPRFETAAAAAAAPLDGQAVAVLGYGNLGRSMALNLREAGLSVTVGNIDDEYRVLAVQDGFEVGDLAAATGDADLVLVLLPDEVIPGRLSTDVTPRLKDGAAVCFASGYVLAYRLVELPDTVDVLLLAPRMLGTEVRRAVEQGRGFLSYLSVEQDATGQARQRLLALARAAGSLRPAALWLTAEQEATLDLFVEQSLGPYLGTAIQLAFAVGVEAGLPPEALVCELYMSGELSQTILGFAEQGFYQAVSGHGLTAMYGGYLGTLGLDQEGMHRRFREVMDRIRAGDFARQLQQEQAAGYPTLAAIRQVTALDNPLSQAEDRVRKVFDGR